MICNRNIYHHVVRKVPMYCPNSSMITGRDGMIHEMWVGELLKAEREALWPVYNFQTGLTGTVSADQYPR